MPRIPFLAALTLAAAAPAVAAQDAVDDLFANPPAVAARAPVSEADPVQPASPEVAVPDPEVAETRRLNAAVDAYNRSVRQTNASAQTEYEQSLSDHAAWLERLEAEQRAEQAAYEAELVRRQQAHEANLAEWRRRVEACQRGVIAACDPSTVR